MTRLIELRKRLARLRHRRQRVRWTTAYSALALAVLWVLAVAFLVDWLFEMNRIQRAISLAAGTGVVVWAFRRWSLPSLGFHETDLGMALLVERQQHIDTDLVAAIEFESPEAPLWGSVELEQAVIEQTAAASKGLNVMTVLSRREVNHRMVLLAATAVVWAAVAALAWSHVATFFNRLLLGLEHYPTRTTIESVAINGRAVDLANPAGKTMNVFYGQSARFEVACSGELPEAGGKVLLTTEGTGLHTTLELIPDEDRPGVYRGEWPRLIESVRYQVHVGTAWAERPWLRPIGMFLGRRRGKAWTESGQIKVTQLPKIEVEPEIYLPFYATKDGGPIRIPTGLRQYSVIEGSRVVLKVTSDKNLNEATVTIDDSVYKMRQADSDGSKDWRDRWVLDAEDTPLAGVLGPVRYSVQVTDADDQRLERPIDGMIRIQGDNPPRIVAKYVTRYVLPTGKPTIYFGATDDFGLGSVSIIREVTHANGKVDEDELTVYRLPAGQRPQRNIESSIALDLSSVKLVKGDTLKATMKAVDFRGKHPGKAALAEPLVFQVTDELGILEGMREADRHSAQQLKSMIQRQLGIGGESP